MISIELIRRYPFFAGLTDEQMITLANKGTLEAAYAGHDFFLEGEELDRFFFVTEGKVDIVVGVTVHDSEQEFVGQILGNLNMKDLTVNTLGVGEMFGWSALIPPHTSSAGARAASDCQVISFDCNSLRPIFEKNPQFAQMMTLKAAQVTRERLREMRMESFAYRLAT